MAKKKINVTLIVIISVIAIGIFVTIGVLTNWFQGKKTNKDKLYNPVLEGKMSNQDLKKSVKNTVPNTYDPDKYHYGGSQAMWNMYEKNGDRVYFQTEEDGEKQCAEANNTCTSLKDPTKCCTGMIPIPPLKQGYKTMNFVGVAGYNPQGMYYNNKYSGLNSKLKEQQEYNTDRRQNIDDMTKEINNSIKNIKKSSGTFSTKKKKKKEETETKLPKTEKDKFTKKGTYPFYRSLKICDDSSPDKKWSECLFKTPREAAYVCDKYNKEHGESLNETDEKELKDVCIGFTETKEKKYLLLGNRYISSAQTFKQGRVDE